MVHPLIYICAEWEAREPGYFSVALFDHRGLYLHDPFPQLIGLTCRQICQYAMA
jgi:hypothetical protein